MISLWPFKIILALIRLEDFTLPSTMATIYLVVNGLIGTVLSDLIWSISMLYTSPLIASIGISLSIPVSLVVDLIFNGVTLTLIYLIGSILVVLGFLLANLGTRKREISLWAKLKTACFKQDEHLIESA